MRRLSLVAVVAALVFAHAPPSSAEPSSTAPRALELRPALDIPLFSLGLVGTLTPELGKSIWAPEPCRFCHREANGTVQVNAFDGVVREAAAGAFGLEPVTWAKTSDVVTFGLLPLGAMALDLFATYDGRPSWEWGTDVALVTQAALVTLALNQLVKFAVGRERPFVAYDPPYASSLRRSNETSADDNLSFFSGHSSLAASVAVGMARTMQLRTGSKLGYWVLVPLAVASGLMRLAADKHWATDVGVGLAVGAAVGWILPTLHDSGE